MFRPKSLFSRCPWLPELHLADQLVSFALMAERAAKSGCRIAHRAFDCCRHRDVQEAWDMYEGVEADS